jgi:ethanolamine ammonia-lyase large subunit
LFARKPAPEFEAWLQRRGLLDHDRVRPRQMPSDFRALLTA